MGLRVTACGGAVNTIKSVAVLRLRHGLADDRERALAKVGTELGISRERARQLEHEAMRSQDASFRRDAREIVNRSRGWPP